MEICVRSKRVEDKSSFNDDVKSVYNECLSEICTICPEPIVLSISHCVTPITWCSEFEMLNVSFDVSVVVTWRRPS